MHVQLKAGFRILFTQSVDFEFGCNVLASLCSAIEVSIMHAKLRYQNLSLDENVEYQVATNEH